MALGEKVRPVVFASEALFIEQFAKIVQSLARQRGEQDVAAFLPRKIALCAHRDDGRAFGKVGRIAPLQPDDDVRRQDRLPCAAHALLLDDVHTLTQSSGVGQQEVDAVQADRPLVEIARRAGNVRDDGAVIPQKGIEERAFPRIGFTDERDPHARSDLASRAVLRQKRHKRGFYLFQPRRDRGAGDTRQVLFGIVEVGVDLREALRELALQLLSPLGERLLIERKPRAHLRLTARRNHLAQALRRGERKFTI